jgi:hypothetical protein
MSDGEKLWTILVLSESRSRIEPDTSRVYVRSVTARDNLRSVQGELQLVSNERQNKVTCSNGEHFPLKQTGTLDEAWITIGFVDNWDAGIVQFCCTVVWRSLCKFMRVFFQTNITNVMIEQNKKQIDWT